MSGTSLPQRHRFSGLLTKLGVDKMARLFTVSASCVVFAVLLAAHLGSAEPLHGGDISHSADLSVPAGARVLMIDDTDYAASTASQLADASGWELTALAASGFGPSTSGESVAEAIELAERSGLHPDVVIINVGARDAWKPRKDLRKDVLRALWEVRELFPHARTLVVGPIGETGSNDSPFGAVDIALARAARQAGTEFVSAIGAGLVAPHREGSLKGAPDKVAGLIMSALEG